MWRESDPQGNEAAKIRHLIVPYTRGRGLDIGCGAYKAWPHFIGVDSGKQWGRPIADVTADCTKLSMFADESMDFVFSSHFIEHTHDYKAALKEWWRVIRPGGALVIYAPHKLFYPNIGEPGANPDHRFDLMPQDVIDAMRENAPSWRLVENEERNGGREYSFFQVFIKTTDGQQIEAPWRKPEKSCMVVRYGGFGDQLQASSILPALKKQGYHITFQCSPKGWDVIRHDPHVDQWWLQDKDQVPNAELGAYWDALKAEGRWDKIINLCESVEGTLLTIPGRIWFDYPHDLRHQMCNVNYLERTHDIAGVPHDFRPCFFATDDEVARMERERQPMGPFCVLWVINGSSEHKLWPHLDVGVTWLLKHSSAHVVLVGDAKEVQDTVEETARKNGCDMSRFHPRAGKWSIRDTLMFAHMVSCVVGPETGVLNAVAMNPHVGKVVMLSHSSEENLTKHWVNTISLAPPAGEVACYPCHRMHYGRDFCTTDPANGDAAMCAVKIAPRTVFDAIMQASGAKKVKAA